MPGTRQRSSILFDLFAASQRVRSLLAVAMDDAGLRPDEYAAYSALFEFEPLSPSELAGVLGMPPTTVSHYVRAMRERGHLREQRNPRDSRSRMLSLSVRGRTAHRRASLAFEGAYQRFVARLADPAATTTAIRELERAADDALSQLEKSATAEAG